MACPLYKLGPISDSIWTFFVKASRAVILAMVMVAVTGVARAQSATGNLTVSATVAASCRITSIGNINFGAYDPLSATPNDAEGNVVFRCVKGTSYKTFITGDRAMAGGSDPLNFQIYSDAGRSAVFPGDNTGNSTTAPSLNPVTQSIYGRISPEQDVTPGNYSATLVATVEY